MSEHTVTITLPRPRISRGALRGLILMVLGASVALAIVALTAGGPSSSAPSGGEQLFTAAGGGFRVAIPAGWTAVGAGELAKTPGNPLAVLRRVDHRGVVVVSETAPVRGDAKTVTAELTAQLKRRFGSFKVVGARIVAIRAGSAFLYTFVRAGAAQSIAVASIGSHTYTIDGVVAGNATDVAQQVGSIVGSFGP